MRKELVIAFMCAGCAVAQTITTGNKQTMIGLGDPAPFGGMGITTALAVPIGTIAGAPYSAQVTTQRGQVLSDGNRIEQTTSGSVARDSQGRTRRDEALPGLGLNGGDAPHIVMIDDPVAQVHWTLNAQNKTANKMPAPSGKNLAFNALGVPPPLSTTTKTWFYSSSVPAPITTSSIQISTISPEAKDANVLEKDLGTQTVEGVAAQGKRTTRTIPAGQIGNEQPITITTETWYSPDLKILVMSTSSDPRIGETTYKLTNIQRMEPAASLFQVSDDYTVKELPMPNVVYQELKKNQ